MAAMIFRGHHTDHKLQHQARDWSRKSKLILVVKAPEFNREKQAIIYVSYSLESELLAVLDSEGKCMCRRPEFLTLSI